MKLTISSSAQLSTQFKSLRKAKGWSQADLGQKLGIGQARVAQIESDPGSISVDKLLQIVHLLGAKLVVDAPERPQHGLSLQRAKEPSAGTEQGLLPPLKNPDRSLKLSITKKKW